MDSGSRKRRLEDKETQGAKQMKIMQQETTVAINEELPKILSPEVLDVLPVFANMLDLKSFMGLAMTCKDMYIRCNEDKRIGINVNENKLEVITGRGPPKFAWRLKNDPRKHREEYLAKLQESGALTLKKLRFSDILTATDDHSLQAACDYLRKMRVKNITEIDVTGNFRPWDLLPSFIEKFHVKRLVIASLRSIPAEALLSLLRLNLEFFRCYCMVPADVLIQVISPIPRIELRGQEANIAISDFKSILSLIQKGHLLNLTIDMNVAGLHLTQAIPYGFDGQIPPNRPLVFRNDNEYYFLHSNGDVTKGVCKHDELELFKCEKIDYPPIQKKEEEAKEDFSEVMKCAMHWRPLPDDPCAFVLRRCWKVSCTFAHFRSFTADFPVIEASHEGPLSAERPLFFVGSEGHFWFLNVHDMLSEFEWNNGEASWRAIEVLFWNYPSFDHPALEKYVIKKYFETTFGLESGDAVKNVSKNVLMSVFEKFKTLPIEFDGPLPDERPLLFEGRDTRVVLAKDGFIYKCEFDEDYGSISKCPPTKLPPSLVNEKEVERILEGEEGFLGKVDLVTKLEKFRDGFSKFKMIPFDHDGPLPEERPLVFVKTQDSDDGVVEQRLFISGNLIIKCEWENGRAVFSIADPQECPHRIASSLVESFFNDLLKEKSSRFNALSLFLKLETVEKSLSSFKVLPYDYTGSVPEDDIVIFMKTEIKDGCRLRDQIGDWPEKMLTIWMLKGGMELTFATWGEKEPQKIVFNGLMDPDDVPPALKTKEYLKRLLLMNNYSEDAEKVKATASWYGNEDDFDACLNEFTQLPYFFDGELPQGPFVFVNDDGYYGEEWLVFREDGSLVTCFHTDEDFTIIGGSGSSSCPPAIRHLCPLAL